MERKYFKNLTDEERRQLKQNIFQQLDLENTAPVRRMISWKKVSAIAIAASVIAAVALFTLRTSQRPAMQKILVAQTGRGEIKHLMLADSSVVILNPSSALYSSSGYSGGKREVYLEGNGFFKVKKMTEDRAFIVHAGNEAVTVLGTQFNVNNRSGNLEVVLTSGSVKVTADDQPAVVQYMQPGDKLTRNTHDREYRKTLVDPLLYSPWIQGEWKFRNTALGDIAQLIGEYYNIDVQFTHPETTSLKMTAVFPVTNLETLLDVIRETLPVTITQQQQQLIIQ